MTKSRQIVHQNTFISDELITFPDLKSASGSCLPDRSLQSDMHFPCSFQCINLLKRMSVFTNFDESSAFVPHYSDGRRWKKSYAYHIMVSVIKLMFLVLIAALSITWASSGSNILVILIHFSSKFKIIRAQDRLEILRRCKAARSRWAGLHYAVNN